jgi:hypothetical protein
MSNVLNLTFERPTTSGAYLGKDGLLKFAPVDEPVLEFNLGGTFRGYRVRTPRTNTIRNNTMVGAVVGTPGTLPTNWLQITSTLNREIIGTGTENGIEYIDVKYSGTAASSTEQVLSFDVISALTAQTWTNSVYLKVISQANAPNVYRLSVRERRANNTTIRFGTKTISPTSILSRFDMTEVLSGGVDTVQVIPEIQFTVTNGQPYDFTIRIGLPQMELGDTATPVIKTSGSAVTTSPDIAFKDPATDILSQGSGAIYFEWENPVEETVYLSDFEFTAIAGINKVRFEYSPTTIRLNVNGTQLTDISGSFDFTGLDRIEVGNFDGALQPDNIYFRAIQTGQLQ